jgi:hypothetical protein
MLKEEIEKNNNNFIKDQSQLVLTFETRYFSHESKTNSIKGKP